MLAMNTDQKERLLKLAETDPILAHKVADFMNTGNTESNANPTQQAVGDAISTKGTDAKDLKWTDALLAKGILSNSISGLGTVVLNNGNAGNVTDSNTGSAKKLTVTKTQLRWAGAGILFFIYGFLSFLVAIIYIAINAGPEMNPAPIGVLMMLSIIIAIVGLAVCSTKSEIPTIKAFLSRNFTVQ